jgi:hypothetical protein
MGKTRDVREAVEKELSYDPLIDAADISVKNINARWPSPAECPAIPSTWKRPRLPGASPG